MTFGTRSFIYSFTDSSPRLCLLSPGQLGAAAGILGDTGMGVGGRISTDPDGVWMVEGFLIVLLLFSGSLSSCMTPKKHSYFITLSLKLEFNLITPECFGIPKAEWSEGID